MSKALDRRECGPNQKMQPTGGRRGDLGLLDFRYYLSLVVNSNEEVADSLI